MQTLYFMSPPGPAWGLRGRANFRSREADPADAGGARREWLALARAIEARGGTVVALPSPDPALTGLPYAAECGHALAREGQRPLFLLPRMKAAHRQAEREHWAPLAARMGFEVVDPGAGIWEAQGDVATFDGCTLLFWGGRTDREGHEAARAHFPGEVLALRIREPAFHGNMALLPLPAVDRMLVCPDVIEPESLQALQRRFGAHRLLPMSEAEIRSYATNGLPVGQDWLAPSVVPERVRALVAAAGMNVVSLPMVNLCEKGGGASRCLVMVARVDGVQVPPEHRLDAVARELEA
ncbi:MAG TPA: amidinotransferase [Aggregicoccus sp.]|nr:amidinotransferase [Aggregicoccus sp.]